MQQHILLLYFVLISFAILGITLSTALVNVFSIICENVTTILNDIYHRPEGRHGGQLQNWHGCIEMAVGCGFTACKLIVRTIRLNKALFYMLLTCICMCLL